MATQRVIGLYILGALLFVLIIVHYAHSVEGFANKKGPSVPDYCGTYGYFVKNLNNPKNIEKQRLYTISECEALKGASRNGWECLKLKNMKQDENGKYDLSQENIKWSYSDKCGGLNYQSTARPSECGSVGKPNVEFKITINGKKIKILANSIMLYTQDECENILQGSFINLPIFLTMVHKTRKEFAAQSGIKIGELNKIIKMNGGEDMGFCNAVDGTQPLPSFSQACTGSAGILGTGGGTLDSFFKWLKSFF